MKYSYHILFFILLFSIVARAQTTPPDLAQIPAEKDKVAAWLEWCRELTGNKKGTKENYPLLLQSALQGLKITPEKYKEERSELYYYVGYGYYYNAKFDSAQAYFYQSLQQGKQAGSALRMAKACITLIPINFTLRQTTKVEECKNLLQSILDTTHNQTIKQDGYSALGSYYYQQKSYYSTALDYFLKSLNLRRPILDTTHEQKRKADFAAICMMVSKLYQTIDVPDRSIAMLNEARRFATISPVVYNRLNGLFAEAYSLQGTIDSALFYTHILEEGTKENPGISSDLISTYLNIADYYTKAEKYNDAQYYLRKADTLAAHSSPMMQYQAQMITGKYYLATRQYNQAINILTASLQLARQFNSAHYADMLHNLAEAEEGIGKNKAALDYYAQYVAASDTLTRQKISRNLADQEVRYQTREKEARITSLDKDNTLKALELAQANRLRTILAICLVAVIIILLLVYVNYRNKNKLNAVLNEKNSELSLLNGKLAVANETKAKLFSIIGHDFRAPVGKIIQLLDLQNEQPYLLTEEQKKKHEKLLRTASENVLEMMESLLLWSKGQMEHFTPDMQQVSVSDIVNKEIIFLQGQFADSSIKTTNKVPAGDIIIADENFLSVILRNLLQNALRHSSIGSTIYIKSIRNGIIITNHTSTATADRLNEQLQNKNINSKYSGMGMQLVKDLAAAISMTISYRQEDDNTIAAILQKTGV